MELETVDNKARNAFGLGLTGTITGGLSILSLLGGVIGLHGMYGNTSRTGADGSSYVTKDELNYVQQIASKDSEIALLKSEQNTEVKITDVYERVMTRVNQNQRDQADWNASQSVVNAQISAAIATNNASISTLQNCCNNLTKIVIPADNVCPKPMAMYNSWTAPTTTTTA